MIRHLRRLWTIAKCEHPTGLQFHIQAQHSEICICTRCGRVPWILTRGQLHEAENRPDRGVVIEMGSRERIPMGGD